MKINVIALLGVLACASAYSQTTNPPVFIGTGANTAGAVGMTWQSQSNLIYRIEYATAVVNSNTQWKTLYEDYPSQGTNTLWKDAGVDGGFNPAPHPNDADKRFYRVVVTGTNSGVQPQVSILSPTNGSILTDYVAVNVGVTSVMSVVAIRLFVDGQE